MKYIKRLSFVLAFVISLSILAGCSAKEPVIEPVSKTQLVIGTVCTITLYDKTDNDIFDQAFQKLSELESTLSINKENTELDKVNENAGIAPVKVSPDTLKVIQEGLKYSELSNGTLDITIGPLVKLWGIGTENARVPSQEEIDKAKALVNYKLVEVDEANSTVYLPTPGMIIDLGAIAKGYAADQVADILRSNGVESAIIDLGGNIFALGSKPDGSDFKVGIQNPEKSRNDSLGIIAVSNKSVVTSGVYERFFEQDGKSYHHILNPKTGYPYDNDILGVSIISDSSIDGDSLSTTLFAMGIEDGLNLINSMDGIEAIYVTKDHDLYMSENFTDAFSLTSSDYTIK